MVRNLKIEKATILRDNKMKKISALCIFSCLALVATQVQAQTTAVVDLIADGGDEKIDVGDVTVALDGFYVDVTFTTDDGWVMTETHVHVFLVDKSSDELLGINLKNGNPTPGKFDFKHEDLGGVTVDEYDNEIDLTDLVIDLIEPGHSYDVCVAAHAEVEVAGNEIDAVEAIGDGDGFAGFDSTAGFSTTDGTNNLGTTTLSLLSGFGQLVGAPRNLAHRGTRGLGVQGGEDGDEVDSVGPENITLTFDAGVWISALELRSLFATGDDDGVEQAEVILSLDGSVVDTQTLTATALSGSDGVLYAPYATPVKADEVLVQIPSGNGSEAAFARLEFAREETAWGGIKGPEPDYDLSIEFPGKNWAIYFDGGIDVIVSSSSFEMLVE
jgi:hypothetical protein